MIKRKIDNANKSLQELRTKDEEFKTRSEDLEASIVEAETDEELETVEAAIDELDTELETHNADKKKLEDEIADLEEELRSYDDKTPKNTNKRTKAQNIIIGGNTSMKVNRGFFKGMERSVADALIAREDVKKFLQD